MDLLEEQYNKKSAKSKKQKFILKLIIILSVLLVFTIIGIVLSLMNGEKRIGIYKITINGEDFDTSENSIIDFEGSKYISISKFANTQGYDYFNGEYGIADEDKSKCYIETTFGIVGFESDTNGIYKANDKLDDEHFTLGKNIITYNNSLYIAVEDLDIAFNLYEVYDEKTNTVTIESTDYFTNKYATQILEQKNAEIDENNENLKAISYERIIVKKNNSYGILDFNFEEIMGFKYQSILFDEYAQTFIVSTDSGKYGLFDINGQKIVNLMYDSIEVLNYSPLLYKVKADNKYGIMKEDGNLLTDIEYDEIGYPANSSKNINYTLIIPEINSDIEESIIACKDNKYGLIESKSGKILLPFDYVGIYSVTREDAETKLLTNYYFIETEETIYFLTDYIEKYNQIIVNR